MSTSAASMKPENLLETRWSLLSRLKDWGDNKSWQEFFETYWGLIYGVAIKAGLTDAEAKDVVQETLITLSKQIGDFKRNPSHGSFKGWLLHTTRWKITDQFRKRPSRDQPKTAEQSGDDGTAVEEPAADAESYSLDAVWEEEWEKHLLSVALENVKKKVPAIDMQIFDLCVLRRAPVKEVAQRLKLKLWKVYFAQKRVAGLLKQELKRLEGMHL